MVGTAGGRALDLARIQDQERPAHVVYLSPQAQAIIDALPRLDDEFVFSVTGKGPVTGFSVAKEKVDAMMRATLRAAAAPWVWHDLRRTVVTGMSENGVAPHIVEAVVNHISGSRAGIAGVYNKASYRRGAAGGDGRMGQVH